MILDDKIELLNFPDKKERFKVIQIYVDEKPYLVCGSMSFNHYEILKNFLEERKINFQMIQLRQNFTIPSSNGERYKVCGMGEAEVFPEIKFFQLPYGSSHDYKIGTDKAFNDRLKELFIGWEF